MAAPDNVTMKKHGTYLMTSGVCDVLIVIILDSVFSLDFKQTPESNHVRGVVVMVNGVFAALDCILLKGWTAFSSTDRTTGREMCETAAPYLHLVA